MSRYFQPNLTNYGADGTIPLVRGDDWKIPGKIIELEGPLKRDVNLTGNTGVTGFFPAASGGLVQAAITVDDARCGLVTMSLGKADTPAVQLSDAGIAPYMTLGDASLGLQTIPTIQPGVTVQDRIFTL